MAPNEYDAIPEWKEEYGKLGIPRNIFLEKSDGESYGFTFEQDDNDRFLALSPKGIAAANGLKEKDIVCVINGKNVTENVSYNEALKLCKQNSSTVELTVIDRKAIKLYEKLNMTITHELAKELSVGCPRIFLCCNKSKVTFNRIHGVNFKNLIHGG